MAMKSILVPVEPHDTIRAALDCACLAAKRFSSHVTGVAVGPAYATILAADPMGVAPIPRADWHDEELAQKAAKLFEGAMTDHGIPAASAGGTGPRHSWLGGEPQTDGYVGSQGRVADLTVVARPTGSQLSARMTTLESALFESGRPLLITPPTAPKSIGERVIIAWNQSTETARCVALAMPFLEKAQSVLVLSIEGWAVPGPSGKALTAHLVENGIKAEERTVPARPPTNGQALLAYAKELDCDLLVKGAYTQSRLRQMIFGGATSHILAAAECPVFMSH